MAKIFISYRYHDKFVRQNDQFDRGHWILGLEGGNYLTARDYVDHLMGKVLTDHINKAEKDDDDLSHLTEETIQQKLYDRIYDSTVTIVLISKNMKKPVEEKYQWIPREIAYSLREKTREDRTSFTNAVLAVALPDETDSYDYAVVDTPCGATKWQTHLFFQIISKNMFNRFDKNHNYCSSCFNHHHYGDDHSYIHPVKWDDFVRNHNLYIDRVLDFKDRIDEFELTKTHE